MGPDRQDPRGRTANEHDAACDRGAARDSPQALRHAASRAAAAGDGPSAVAHRSLECHRRGLPHQRSARVARRPARPLQHARRPARHRDAPRHQPAAAHAAHGGAPQWHARATHRPDAALRRHDGRGDDQIGGIQCQRFHARRHRRHEALRRREPEQRHARSERTRPGHRSERSTGERHRRWRPRGAAPAQGQRRGRAEDPRRPEQRRVHRCACRPLRPARVERGHGARQRLERRGRCGRGARPARRRRVHGRVACRHGHTAVQHDAARRAQRPVASGPRPGPLRCGAAVGQAGGTGGGPRPGGGTGRHQPRPGRRRRCTQVQQRRVVRVAAG